MNKHCCIKLKSILKTNKIIKYYPKVREYAINMFSSPSVVLLDNCPFCGAKLPESLRDQYFDILEEEYNLDNYDIDDHPEKIPEEFKSDEWWRKRRL